MCTAEDIFKILGSVAENADVVEGLIVIAAVEGDVFKANTQMSREDYERLLKAVA